jgi:hypothetical protein
LAPVGQIIGNVGGVDPNNFTFNCTWGKLDRSNAFAISRSCNISVLSVQDTVSTLQSVFTYTLNMSNNYATSSTPITITLLPVFRPPNFYDQYRIVRDDAPAGTSLLPGLSATHPQHQNIHFEAAAGTPFNVTLQGIVYVRTNGQMNFQIQSNYTLRVAAIDDNGLRSEANIFITLSESNKVPYFESSAFYFSVSEGAYVGTTAAGSTPVHALDPNSRDSLRYQLWNSIPASQVFALDAASGYISLGAGLGLTGGKLIYDSTQIYALPRTHVLNITVTDNGSPPLRANTTAFVEVLDIKPRFMLSTTMTLPGNATIGTPVINVSAGTWTAYARSSLRYSLAADLSTTGDQAFDINNVTGVVTIANVSYRTNVNGVNITSFRAPSFDYNSRSTYELNITATDIVVGQFESVTVHVQLSHINRSPIWLPVPKLYARALYDGDIGNPLRSYVIDPDTLLPGILERLTFSIVSGNVDNTFGIVASSGQLYVANNNTPSFDLTNIASIPVYNLSIAVQDAGIDGGAFTAVTYVFINVTRSNLAPSIGFFNMSIDELVPVGTIVGSVSGTDHEAGSKLNYTIAPAGPNINQPFPFYISTLAGGAGNFNTGLISVIDDGQIDWNNRFKVYFATVTVTDQDPVTPLSGSGPLTINVQWVAKPPYFNPSKMPASWVFTLSVVEHVHGGTLVSASALAASSKDPWERPNLRYRWLEEDDVASIFTLNPITAMVNIAAGAPNLQYNDRKHFTLTILVIDSRGLNDTATVRINIVDVNDAAEFIGLATAGNHSIGLDQALVVAEVAPTGEIFGFVRAFDQDLDKYWGQVNYGLMPTADAAFIAIDRETGALSVACQGLDYWDQTQLLLNVTVSDGDFFKPITVYRVITVNITQANTVTIVGFAMSSTTAADNGVNVSDSDNSDWANNVDVLISTGGSPNLLILGHGFGRTARRLAAESATAASAVVVSTFGYLGTEHVAVCSVLHPNTVIGCDVPEGIGSGLTWRVTVDRWTTVRAGKFGYFAPNITSVMKIGVPADARYQVLSTAGADKVNVTGSNFGPAGTIVTLQYGTAAYPPRYRSSCVVLPPGHTVVTCSTTEGYGTALGFQLIVGAQRSPVFVDTPVKYEAPRILEVTAPILNTEGGQLFSVSGTGFGPEGTPGIQVVYSQDEAFENLYYKAFTALSCRVSKPHTEVQCMSAAGSGKTLRVRITVGDQSSAASPSNQTLQYAVPVISGISGLGSAQAATQGGQQVYLSGSQFGLITPLDDAGNPLEGSLQPVVEYGHLLSMQYTAAACRVSVANRQVICLTAEGTGKSLHWKVTIGEQVSEIFMNKTTSYAAPMVASYTGEGCHSALTQGGQLVLVTGQNFGPLDTVVEQATYGYNDNGTKFEAWNCSVVHAHTQIQCLTTVGAGAGLTWYIVIDGQRSVSPSTDYGIPEISSFSGPGSNDASTDGGDMVVITGSFFSVPMYLDSVTYGAAGNEYDVTSSCEITVNHTEISCITKPGVGRALKWLITVAGQVNELSGIITSYACPQIRTLSPAEGPTEGGTLVTITGTDFGVNAKDAVVSIKLSNVGQVAADLTSLSEHFQSIYQGAQGNPEIADWISNKLSTLMPTSYSTMTRGVHQLTVVIPEGYGPNRTLFVEVNGVPSNIITYTYTAPQILNVAPDRQNVTAGFLRVFLEGRSFCNGVGNCGTLSVNDGSSLIPIEIRGWSHNTIEFVMPDPPPDSPPATAVVVVGGIASTPKAFKKPVPNLSNLVTQLAWVDKSTQGGEHFTVLGVLDIGIEPVTIKIGTQSCSNVVRRVTNDKPPTDPAAIFSLDCVTPAGVGKDLPVLIGSLGGMSRRDSALTFSYAAPQLLDLYTGGIRRLTSRSVYLPRFIPTLGANVSIMGRNLGNAELASIFDASYGGTSALYLDEGLQLLVYSYEQTQVVAYIPPGDGAAHYLQMLVAYSPSDPLPFSYAIPSILSVVPNAGHTQGGTIVTITGTNFGISRPVVQIAGRPCTLLNNFTISSNHDFIQCITPPGQDVAQLVTIIVNGQQSVPAGNSWFHYHPPAVASVSPQTGPTSGRSLGIKVGAMGFADGDNIVQVITGQNFGEHGLVTFEPVDSKDPLSANITVPDSKILSWNHTSISIFMPEGFGDLLNVVVRVGSQTSRSTSDVHFSYEPPQVFNVTRHDRSMTECEAREQCFHFGNITNCKMASAGCYDTTGGYPVRIIGNNFGPPAISSLYSIITIGGARCERDDRFEQSHTALVCRVARGSGDDNVVVVSVGKRVSEITNWTIFAYDPPVISAILPSTPDALGTQMVRGTRKCSRILCLG